MKIEEVTVGNKYFYAEDNCTYKFNSFRVLELEATSKSRDESENAHVFLRKVGSLADEYYVLTREQCEKNLFKKKKDAEAVLDLMKKMQEKNNKKKEKKEEEGRK